MRQDTKKPFKIEEKYVLKGYEFVIGVDEAGRGPLAGPVVACAAMWRHSDPALAGEESRRKKISGSSQRSFANAQDDGK